ncbi:regulator of G-protein signaling 10-like [Clytia hemisphaerica]|uniref:regulator of G-protein signaling 10-like n=1 Tax=Clytia hemisphaerica TaxID=252671 RepID=UPI0034D76E4F
MVLEMLLDCFFSRRQSKEDSENRNKRQSRPSGASSKSVPRNSIKPLSQNHHNDDHKVMESESTTQDNNNCTFDNRNNLTIEKCIAKDNFKNMLYGTPSTTPILFFGNGSPKDVQSWSESLDKLLDDPIGIQTFFMHLKEEHSTENIRFWLACENYKNCSAEMQDENANRIFDEFLSRRATSQINVSCGILRDVKKEMNRPSSVTFLKIQHEIYNLMRTDSYPRFLKSKKYLKMLQDEPSQPETNPNEANRKESMNVVQKINLFIQ